MVLLLRSWSLLAVAALATVANAQTSPQPIIACVSRVDGFSRIVASPSACILRFERVVQWNSQGPAGPTGPTGPQGPAGPQGPPGPAAPALAHTILVPASGTPQQNGQMFAAALASITDASATAPYLIQLDAGTYAMSNPPSAPSIQLPAFVSVKGAGMFSTFITSPGTAFSYDSIGTTGNSVASLSDFTITASGGYTTLIKGIKSLSVDHVQINGYAYFTSMVSGARISIANSVFNGPTSVGADQGHVTLLGTQVLNFYGTSYSPGVLACFSVYDINLQPYPSGCISSAP